MPCGPKTNAEAALQHALAEFLLGPELDIHDRAAVEAWLSRYEVTEQDRALLLTQSLEGLLVYRGLVRKNLREAVEVSIPRTLARLGPKFEVYFGRFLADRGPRTHYLRDVTGEFIDYSTPLWQADPSVPAYIPELARHEFLRIEVAAHETSAPSAPDAELHLDQGLQFIEAARLVEYEHAVHELPEDETDLSAPARRPTRLFVYRSPEHDVRYLELTPLAAEILRQLLIEGATLRAALVEACRRQNAELDDRVLEGTARVLSDLAERGALLGPKR